jgi:hypothetical protein
VIKWVKGINTQNETFLFKVSSFPLNFFEKFLSECSNRFLLGFTGEIFKDYSYLKPLSNWTAYLA